MKKVTLVKGDETVEVYESEVGHYKKKGWTRKGEKRKTKTKSEVK